MSMGPFTMSPLSVQEFTVAHITAINYINNTPPSSVPLLKSYTDDIINFYACDSVRTCTSQLLSVNENTNHDEFNLAIYPNPTKDLVNINSDLKIESVELYSITGQKLMVKQSASIISLSDFPKGFYLLKVLFENGKSSTVRVVKK